MDNSSHKAADYVPAGYTEHDGFTSGRTSFADYTPSDVTSLFSEDYLASPFPTSTNSNSTMSRFVATFRNIDWIDVAIILNDWNLTLLQYCTPSFLHNFHAEHEKKHIHLASNAEQSRLSAPQTQQREDHTSIKCLDGLRGVACFFVFNFHFLFPFTKTILNGYGVPNQDGVQVHSHTHQLPFFSLPYRGRAMVAVFFAISGYVLSRKVLITVRSGNADSARRMLSSSVFRRGLRLYIPPIVSTFLVMLLVYMGAFLSEKQVYEDGSSYITGSHEEHPPRSRFLVEQFWHWYQVSLRWSNPFTWDAYFALYDPHTWTIPIEFRGSIVLFATLLGTANLKSVWRLVITSCMTFYCFKMSRWDVGLFLAGSLLCELDLITGTWNSPTEVQDEEKLYRVKGPNDSSVLYRTGFMLLKCIALVVGLYFLSYPDLNAKEAVGYATMARWVPDNYPWKYAYWHSLGAICAVWAINNLRAVRGIFECGLCQYLGKISFAFYLVHGPILHSVGFRIMPAIWDITGFNSDEGFVTGLAIGWVLLLILSIWIADLFWRAVDMPSTKLARKLERLLSSRAS